MVDTVTTNVLFSGRRHIAVQFTNLSDGTGESDVKKTDKSSLVTFEGLEPSKLVLEEVSWSISGFSAVELYWDHDANDAMVKLAASGGFINYRPSGGLIDPGSTGGTGDVLLSTFGAAANATYDITYILRLKQ